MEEREEVLVCATALVTLENILANERSQAGKDKTTQFHLYFVSRMAYLRGQKEDEQSQQVGRERSGHGCQLLQFLPEMVKMF